MVIKTASQKEINVIQSIAHRTWPVAYADILSKAQLEYMLRMMYSAEALDRNFENGVRFILAQQDDLSYGFAGFEYQPEKGNRTHIHKIYVLPEAQGRYVGKALMDYIENWAKEVGSDLLTLNVNRHNKALHFYLKHGFEILETVNIAIGNGYLMEDYVMGKRLSR